MDSLLRGAGALGTVALLSLTSLTAAQVVGTDLAFGLCIAVVGTGVHWFGGHYDGGLLMKMAIGGVVGGIMGSGAAPRIPNRQLRFAFVVMADGDRGAVLLAGCGEVGRCELYVLRCS